MAARKAKRGLNRPSQYVHLCGADRTLAQKMWDKAQTGRKKRLSDKSRLRGAQRTEAQKAMLANTKWIASHSGPRCTFYKHGQGGGEYPAAFYVLAPRIRRRDEYLCRICGVRQSGARKGFPVHHINGDRNDLDPMNLVTLCASCHGRVHGGRERESEWQKRLNADQLVWKQECYL